MKKLIEIDETIWKRFERVAVAEFGLYGAITKGVGIAIEEWVQKGEEKDINGYRDRTEKEGDYGF